jgi:hypothetical protein
VSACAVDWGLIADWVAAIAAAGTLGVAVWAARSWREQLRGGSKHTVAQEVATAARALRYAFYGARSPLIEGWEFPESYWSRGPTSRKSNTEEAEAYRHVYHRRIKELWPTIRAVADLRARAGAVLGEETAKDLENLAKKARELDFFFEQDVDARRAGPEGVKQWTDQGFVERVRQSVVVHDPPDDRFSKEFEEMLRTLLERVKPHL